MVQTLVTRPRKSTFGKADVHRASIRAEAGNLNKHPQKRLPERTLNEQPLVQPLSHAGCC